MRNAFPLVIAIAAVALAGCRQASQAATTTPPAAQAAATVAAEAPAAPAPAASIEQDDARAWSLPGWLTPTTTRRALAERFGHDNVRDEHLTGIEGIEYDAWVLFPDDPSRRLELMRSEGGGDRTLTTIHVSGAQTVWRDANGLHPGMPLERIVERNGKPVGFSGLDWDYGGIITDWNDGKLAPGDGQAVFPSILLTRRADLPDAAEVPIGDDTFRSDDPRWPTVASDLVIGEMFLSWPDEEH